MQLGSIDVEAIDVERIAAVSEALGVQRFGELMAILGIRLQRLSAGIEKLPECAAELVSALHQSRGSAASLGLVGLTIALTDIEAQIARTISGNGPAPEASRMASVRIAGRALHGYWRAAAGAASRHIGTRDQASCGNFTK